MKYAEFKNEVEKGNAFSIYLFEGEDAFFREKGLTCVKNAFVTEPELNCAYFEGEKINLSEVSSSLSQYPFLSKYRLTVIREFYSKKEGLKQIANFLENPLEGSLLAILNEKPCEALKGFQSVNVVDCSKSDAITIARWIKGTCINAGVAIDMETAKTIAEYCALDMTRVCQETEKLIAYKLDEKLITSMDVNDLVNRDVEYKIYEMTEYVGKRQFENALSVINDMLAKGETLQKILVSVYNYFRRLLHVAISAKTDAELAQILGIKDFAVKKAKAQASKFSKRALKKAVDALYDTDYLIKSGAVDADSRIWLTIFSIMVEGE
ncbi:MAG: DNA polymerase III subunit delta [Clostridia bacterium]|nr:DNA polymerase III subunit delta [Clostridia bacterium]